MTETANNFFNFELVLQNCFTLNKQLDDSATPRCAHKCKFMPHLSCPHMDIIPPYTLGE